MYRIEWIGMPRSSPEVIGGLDRRLASIEDAMDQADWIFTAKRKENPRMAGYRIFEDGAACPVITWWSEAPLPGSLVQGAAGARDATKAPRGTFSA